MSISPSRSLWCRDFLPSSGAPPSFSASPRAAGFEPAAALLAAPYIEPARIAHAFLGGIAFVLVARQHKSLGASIVAHLANNLVGIIVIAGLLALR